ncbi:MAG: nitroreductase family protein [Verrucomicrobiia bacterium]|jgi:nitroreductase
MELFEAINSRRSIRKYKSVAIEPEKINKIYDVITRAPSAGNLQAYQVYVVKDIETKKRLAKAALDQEFIVEAPIVLVFCAVAARSKKYGKRGETLYCIQDATIAAAYAQLAATALGLSTCWVGAFDESEVVNILRLPIGHRPIAMLPIGYADESPEPTSRRAIDDLIKQI